MKVVNCPACGSDKINENYFSAEYMSSATWRCDECGWFYKKGSGIGTGSDNSGTHPRNVEQRTQSTLGESGRIEQGRWCANCETCIAGAHGCRAEEHIEDGEVIPQDEIVERLNEHHYNGEDALIESIEDGSVYLEPNMFAVTTSSDTDQFDELLLNILEQPADEDTAPYGDVVSPSAIRRKMGVKTNAEKAFVKKRLDKLWQSGEVQKTKRGYCRNNNERS